MEQKTPKKRGRKPKNKVTTFYENTNTDLPIIAHLPINVNETITETETDIFMRNVDYEPDNDISEIINEKNNKISELENTIKKLKKKIATLENDETIVYEVDNNDINFPCWWCRHCFETPAIKMVVKHYNNQFYLDESSNFCSFECCEAYNINLNDINVSTRSSLLRQYYYKTYGQYKDFKKAPHWSVIKGLGGCISIEKYRDNFTVNDKEYIYMKPPIVSRLSQVEKISLISKPKKEKYVLKRSKPLKTNKYSIMNTMGL